MPGQGPLALARRLRHRAVSVHFRRAPGQVIQAMTAMNSTMGMEARMTRVMTPHLGRLRQQSKEASPQASVEAQHLEAQPRHPEGVEVAATE